MVFLGTIMTRTVSDEGCITRGEVQGLEQARGALVEAVAQGVPRAYVEASDATTYSLQLSLPPFGITLLELILEDIRL
jgi:hypothetical protein